MDLKVTDFKAAAHLLIIGVAAGFILVWVDSVITKPAENVIGIQRAA